MGISIQKVLADLPKARQEKIKAKADKYIREYETLAALRKDLGITQEAIATEQGVKQVSISNLEKRNDMLISTLHKYVEALGGKLEIRIRMSPAGLVNVHTLNAASSSSKRPATVRMAAAKKSPVKFRKAAAKR